MKFDLRTIVLLGVIALLCFLLFDTCSSKTQLEDQAIEYANYKDTVMTYKARNGDVIAYNKSLEINKGLMLKLNDSLSGALKNIKIKDPVSYTKIVTVTEIDTVEVRFTDTLPCSDFFRTFRIDSSHYKLDGNLTNKSLTINGIQIPNTQNIVVGTKKNGLFKKNEYIITVQNSNPYMQVTGLQNYTLTPKKRFYEKTWFVFSAGFVAGFVTDRQLSK